MKKFILTTYILVISGITCFGADISGMVTDPDGKGIADANIALISLPDSAFVTAGLSDKNGLFTFEGLNDREYQASVSCFGYIPVSAPCRPANRVRITLTPNPNSLKEVTITARQIKRRASGYSVNLACSDLPEGKGSLEMLGYLPHINYDTGAISVFQKSPYAIYVDGVRVTDTQQLEAIPASMIKSVDVAYTAGVGEASNASGAVIKIRLKKASDGGFIGNITGRTETMPDYGYTGGRLSNYIGYRKGNLSLSNTGMYNHSLLIEDTDNAITYKTTGASTATTDRYRDWSTYAYEQINAGYEFNESNELLFSVLFSHTGDDEKLGSKDAVGIERSKIYSPHQSNLLHLSGNYNRVLNEKGASLEVAVDYLHRHGSSDESMTDLTTSSTELAASLTNTNLLRGKMEANIPIGDGSLNAGVDMQYARHTDLTSRQPTVAAIKNVWTAMDGYRPAVFASYSGQAGKFQYEAGLRFQGNVTRVSSGGKRNDKNIWKLCPKIDVMYMIDPENETMIMASYKRTVDELPYSVISSYRDYSTPLQYTTGNPAIKSPINDELIIAGSYSVLSLSTGLYRTGDPVIYLTTPDPNNHDVVANTAANGKYETMFFTGIEGIIPITAWWKAKPSITYSLHWADMVEYTVKHQEMWKLSLNNSFKFSKSIGGTLRTHYEPTTKFRNMRMHSVWSLRGSVYKTFMNNYLQFVVGFTAYAKGRKTVTETPDFTTIYENTTKTPSVSLKVVWHFRGGKRVKVNDNINAIQDYHQYEIQTGRD